MAEATTATGEPGAVGAVLPELVASFFTLSGAGFGEPPRNGFIERCEAAAAAGFSGIGMHADDLPRTAGCRAQTGEMQAVLRINGLDVVEIEFLGGWAVPTASPAPRVVCWHRLAGIEVVASGFGGRHVSAGEFRGPPRVHPESDGRDGGGGIPGECGPARPAGSAGGTEAFPWSAITDGRLPRTCCVAPRLRTRV